MNIIDKIFEHKSLIERPPVLLDIGAAGNIHPVWKSFAKYSIGIAFDADRREMGYISNNSGFKDLYVFPCIVGVEENELSPFYLTKYPQCSSTLKPNLSQLKKWSFAHLFEIVEEIKINARTLSSVLHELKLDYIDWYKSDSQGTDLRLFSSLPKVIQDSIIVADFEPGITNAYIGEDKLFELMGYFEKMDYWVTNLRIKGDKRIHGQFIGEVDQNEIKMSPGWGEITYLKEIEKLKDYDIRELLLMWIFSTELGQYGYAIEIAFFGKKLFPKESIFDLIIDSEYKSKPKNLKHFTFIEKMKFKLKKLIDLI